MVRMNSNGAGRTSAGRRRFDIGPATVRSAIANGSRLLDGIDARSAPARRYRDITSAVASDLGGADQLTEVEQQLVRSFAGLVVLREHLDARALNGEGVSSAQYTRIVNSLRRLAATIGIERRARDVTPDATERVLEAIRSGAA